MIFCRLPFEKAGSCNNLFKFNKETKKFIQMATGELYNPFNSGGVLSPDKTKIALAPYNTNDATGKTIGYIDLANDTYTTLKTVENQDKSFVICEEMSCGSEITWLNNDVFEVNVYEWCAAFNECLYGGETPRVPVEVMKISTRGEVDEVLSVKLTNGSHIEYTNAAPDCSIFDKDIYTIVFGDGKTAKADCKGFGSHDYVENGTYSVQYMRNQEVIAEEVVTVVK